MKIIIIEDESNVISVIEHLLTDLYPFIEIVGKATSISKAKKLIENIPFDLALVDIQIEEGTSFDLLNDIQEINFHIIFITAYEHYALDAFKRDAIDYIVKPINSDRLKKAIDKALNYVVNSTKNNVFNLQKRLLVNTANELHALKYDDIVRFEADNNYTKIITIQGDVLLVSKTLKDFEKILQKTKYFVRVHRSHIVSLNHFYKLTKIHGDTVVLNNGDEVPLSPVKKQLLINFLNT